MAAIGLLILTGARLMEILTLRWEYVDFENEVLRLPDSKTGAKLIHLNEPAINLLRALPRIGANPHVIAGTKDRAPLVNLQKPWRRICAKSGLTDVRLHDLRHSFASVAVGSGMSLPMIGKLLGHTQPATTARYGLVGPDRRDPALARWSRPLSLCPTTARQANDRPDTAACWLPAAAVACLLSRWCKSFNQCGHSSRGDFGWLLPKLTVEVSVIVSVKAAFEDHSSRRAVKEAGRNAEGTNLITTGKRIASLLRLGFHRCSLRRGTMI